ncbi:MAG TPA: right-handed parallel beta-helix repeat-containing protein, partial [Phycisphaerae bacterium]|nr:right-handed parallel beta-helix repeat-containing protein [Phycisphaerae bacterium]
RQVSAFSSATSTLTVSSSFGLTPRPGQDRYCLTHLVSLISGEGQWAVKDLGGGNYRLFVWADGGGDPDVHTMEASRRLYSAIDTNNKPHWVIDNLEARHTQGHGIGNTGGSANAHYIIRNCVVHSNDTNGINGRLTDTLLQRNLVFNNTFGINAYLSDRVVVELNELAFNNDDALEITGSGDPEVWYEDFMVRRNSIHHQILWGHPDSMMIWNYLRNVTIEDNLLYAAGQHAMLTNLLNVTITNNVMYGSYACALIVSGGGQVRPMGVTTRKNTIAMSCMMPVSHATDSYDHANNIIVAGNPAYCWGNIDETYDYTSDYNQFWHGPGLTATPVVWDAHYGWTLAQYVADSGEDTHSTYGDPQFTNAPLYMIPLDTEARQDEYTTTKVYLWSYDATDYFAVGDHIEINSDGVVRTVTSVGSDYVTFTPGDDYIAIKCNTIANWGENTNYAVDIAPQAAITGSDSLPVGSTINVQEFLAGDFNGDGRRDVPEYPQPDE